MTSPTVLTVDVEGDWAGAGTRGVDEVLPRLVNLLDAHRVDATFFVLGDLADRAAPHLRGTRHEVASHTMTHRRLGRLSPDEQRWEVATSKRRLEAAGFPVQGFRAPYLQTTRLTGEHLADAGYRYDASLGRLHPLGRRRGVTGVPSVPLGRLQCGLPFTMTWLRLLGRGAHRLVSSSGVLLCHLHDFLDDGDGRRSGFRRVHERNAGEHAWRVLDRLLVDPGRHFVTARSLV